MSTLCFDFDGGGYGGGGHDWGLGNSMNSKLDYDLANGKHGGSGSSGGGCGTFFWVILGIIIVAAITEGWTAVLVVIGVLVLIIGTLLLILYFKQKANNKPKS